MAQVSNSEGGYHLPVMVEQVVALLGPIERGIVVDATFGGGGHTRALMERMSEVTFVGIDRDPAAMANADALGVRFLSGDFGNLGDLLSAAGIVSIAGALFDFGVSSHQIDEPSRGFSYRHEGPLDMRMDPDQADSAADLVNRLPERELAKIIATFGEEPMAGRIARAIVARRPFTTTTELAEVVAGAIPAAVRRKGHPARKTFQALRIAVNNELDSITRAMDDALDLLEVNGRVVTIAYHSLEDRIVKRRFASATAGCICPPGLPVCGCGAKTDFRLLTPKALKPTPSEIARNPRARSARLRGIERLAA